MLHAWGQGPPELYTTATQRSTALYIAIQLYIAIHYTPSTTPLCLADCDGSCQAAYRLNVSDIGAAVTRSSSFDFLLNIVVAFGADYGWIADPIHALQARYVSSLLRKLVVT